MNKKVRYARFQTSLFMPGINELGSVLPPINKQIQDLSMATTSIGLLVSLTLNGQPKAFIVPYGNIIGMELEPEQDNRAKLKAVVNE